MNGGEMGRFNLKAMSSTINNCNWQHFCSQSQTLLIGHPYSRLIGTNSSSRWFVSLDKYSKPHAYADCVSKLEYFQTWDVVINVGECFDFHFFSWLFPRFSLIRKSNPCPWWGQCIVVLSWCLSQENNTFPDLYYEKHIPFNHVATLGIKLL